MGLTLGPVLAVIFMDELKRTVSTILREHISAWKRHVDDTISYIKEESIEHVLSKPNGYHDNIKFTYETKKVGKLPFSDVIIICKDYEIKTTVYLKVPTVIYISTGSCFPQQHGSKGCYRH